MILFQTLWTQALKRKATECPRIHSFIFIHSAISIAPLQVLYYSEALPTTARILYRSFHAEAHRQLQVKVKVKDPTWQLERESNPAQLVPPVESHRLNQGATTSHSIGPDHSNVVTICDKLPPKKNFILHGPCGRGCLLDTVYSAISKGLILM